MIYLRVVVICLTVIATSCDRQNRQASSETGVAKMQEGTLVVTSNYPLYFFASRIAEGVVDAPEIVLPKIKGDPASWVPSAEQIQQLQSADAVILNGAGYESWLSLVTIDQRRLVDTSGHIKEQLIPLEGSLVHQHGPGGEHSHEGTAFTVWLDPRLAIVQAESITDALIRILPSGKTGFRENMARLESDLMELDASLAAGFSRLNDQPVLFSHPVYQYLQRRYELNGQSVHWEPDEEPSTSDWISLQRLRSKHTASIMIWEGKPLSSIAERLSEVGIESVSLRPLANSPGQGDYLSEMRADAKRLEALLSSD